MPLAPAVAVFAATLMATSLASATDASLPIRVDASGAPGCPDAAKVASATNASVHRDALAASEEEAPVRIVVEFAHGSAGHSAVIRVIGGERAGVRALEDSGAKCDDLAEAVVVTLAIMLDEGLVAAPTPIAPEPAPLPAPAPAPAPKLVDKPSPPPSAPPASRSVAVAASAGVGASLGVVRAVAPSFFAALELANGPIRIGLGGRAILPQRFSRADGFVEVSLLAAEAFACMRVAPFTSACGSALVGVQSAHAEGLDVNGGGSLAWLALAPGLHVDVPLLGPLAFTTRVAALVPIGRRPAFEVTGVGLLYEPPAIAASFAAGLTLTNL